jgi:hypothetical protein
MAVNISDSHTPPEQASFRFEKDMLLSARNLGVHLLLRQIGIEERPYITAAQEISIGSVIPDLLVACWRAAPRWKQRSLSSVESAVIAYLLDQKLVPEKKLKADLFLTDSGATRALTGIKDAGFSLQDSDELIETCFPNDDVNLVAFEFKLKKWNDALEQASSYFDFANESYVVVDANQVKPDGISNKFAEAGVGLIFQDHIGYRMLLRSSTRLPRTASRVQVLSKLALLPGVKTGQP